MTIAYCESVHERPAVLDHLPGGYQELFDRAVAVFASDARFRAVWLAGSLARGTADAASDLDLIVAVRDEDLDELAGSWRRWLAEITPTVLAEEQWFAKGSFWSITPGYERFDVVLESASQTSDSLFPVRVVVFDRDDLTAQLPAERRPTTSAATVAKLVEDWFHFSAMVETILWREDWLLASEHLHFLRGLLYKLYVEANQPLAPMGLKRWSDKLTGEQRRTLERLPTAASTFDDLVATHLAVSRAFLATAERLAARLELSWPDELEAAATRHVAEVLGIEDPYPRQ